MSAVACKVHGLGEEVRQLLVVGCRVVIGCACVDARSVLKRCGLAVQDSEAMHL